MRLINVRTRRTEEFYGKAIPKYAILSHTWGLRETTLQTMQTFGASYKRWPLKLSGLCMQAADDGIDYVWVDTCCINKMDLVELSEAINSMFTWYQKADVCYAYLADVELQSEELEPDKLEPDKLEPEEACNQELESLLPQPLVHKRLDLQELLAPDQVKFYDSKWVFIGTKCTLSTKLQVVTGIPRSFILGATPVSEASVAQRFSWAANRETTRVEDMAYCLLGLFNVNMPMIYGEREKAFVRLQREIMNVHRDQSILAWGFRPDDEGRLRTNLQQSQTEVLATHPEQFRHCSRLVTSQTFPSQNTFEWLTGTLKLHLTLFTNPADGVEYGLLNCGHEKGPEETLCHVVGLPLTKLPAEGPECYTRKPGTPPKVICYDPVNVTMPRPRVVQLMGLAPQNPNNVQSWIYLEEPAIPFQKYSFSLVEVSPRAAWKQDRDMIDTSVTSEPGVVVAEVEAGAAGTPNVDKPPDTSSSNRETVFYLRYRYAQYGSSTQPEDDFVVRVEPNRPPRLPQAKISVTRLSRTQELQDFVRAASSGIHVDESKNTYVGQTEDEKLAVVVSLSLRTMAGQSVLVLELSASERSGNRPCRDNAIPEMLWQLTGLDPALRLPHYKAEALTPESLSAFLIIIGMATLLCPWLLWKLWQGWKRFAGDEIFSVGEEASLLTILSLGPTQWFFLLVWFGYMVFWTLFLPFMTCCVWKATYVEAVAVFWQI